MKPRLESLLVTTMAVLAACDSSDTPDTAVIDSGFRDAAVVDRGVADTGVETDTGVAPDSGVETDSGVAPDTGTTDSGAEAQAVLLDLAPGGHDRLFGAAYDSQGNLYATGVISTSTINPDLEMVLVKITADGQLDTNFGQGGIARINVAQGGAGEVARGIVVQSTGKIVISGSVEHEGAADPRDRDIAVVRFNSNGTLDNDFGTNGRVILDLSDGEVVGNNYVADATWGLSSAANDALVVTGARKADGRTDADFVLARLTADGDRDPSFGTNGVFTLDNANNANPRNAIVLADQSIVMSGYFTESGIIQPVLFKVTSTGTLARDFGVNGVFTRTVLGAVTEAYGAALQGDNFVTTGYGRDNMNESLDWISLRITQRGAFDSSYGTNGVARLDVAGFNDNSRSLVVLPDNRVLLIGGGRPVADNIDAMIAVLTVDGRPDTTFAANGYRLYDLGGAADFFWGVAVSPNGMRAAAVGLKGAAAMSGDDDDSALLLLPVD